ncbi:MAG TPA: hypothetical protein VF811_00575 [Parasulfuritortus sp.]
MAERPGCPRFATDTGLGRESLYKALPPGAKPRYDTRLKRLHGLGVELLWFRFVRCLPMNEQVRAAPQRGAGRR